MAVKETGTWTHLKAPLALVLRTGPALLWIRLLPGSMGTIRRTACAQEYGVAEALAQAQNKYGVLYLMPRETPRSGWGMVLGCGT